MRSIVPKERYIMQEDIIRVIVDTTDGERLYFLSFQYKNPNIITLDTILEDVKFKLEEKEIESITVLAEDVNNGRIIRYDPLTYSWHELGVTYGYA